MNNKQRQERITRRSDFTCGLVHLTKANGKRSAIETLIKILQEKKLNGGKGYVCGNDPVVCLQDVPLHSLSENILYEQKLHNEDNQPTRYSAFGLRFSKEFIYKNGGRPVLYEKTETAKKLLSPNEYWRIVCLDLSDSNNVIDWTHEREWRIKGDLDFQWKDVEILLSQEYDIKRFLAQCNDSGIGNILDEVKGIITLKSILF